MLNYFQMYNVLSAILHDTKGECRLMVNQK